MQEIHYFKAKKIDLGYLENKYERTRETASTYNPFKITKLQNYNPIYSLFFEMNDKNYNAISLNHPNHMIDLDVVQEESTNKKNGTPIHIKYAPLLDPIHYLIGKYEKDKTKLNVLPTWKENSTIETPINKIKSPYNSAYVDCFFSYLSSKLRNHYEFSHGIDFYGSYLGIQEKFRMDITDDYEYLTDSEFFLSKKNIFYELESADNINFPPLTSTKPKLILGDTCILEGGEEIEISSELEKEKNEVEVEIEIEPELELVYEKLEKDTESMDYETDSSNNSEIADSEEEEEDEEEEEEEEEEDEDDDNEKKEEEWSDMEEEEEPIIHAYIRNFPVQMICLEKCESTLDELLENDQLNEKEIESAIFQIVMILATYQKAYSFTHNDLHTNNIVYISTEKTHIQYTFLGKTYKVPTYGKLYKLIDFGRSIYRFQDKIIGSDSFETGGDAHTQYNCEPFYNPLKKRIDPNMSFDLCRLGCSLYDFVFDDMEESEIRKYKKEWTEIQKTVVRWCTDDSNKNILYKSSGEERYPNFKLYKMIGRMVHQHTPENQMAYPLFYQYDIKNTQKIKKQKKKTPENILIQNIDKIPKMYSI